VHQIGAFADEDVAEGRVTVVARPAEHQKVFPELAGEEHAVAVARQKGVFELFKVHEILRAGDADGGAVIAVAPRHVMHAADQGDARIVGVFVPPHLLVVALENDRFRLEGPFQAIGAAADVQMRHAVHAFGAKHADELPAKRHHGAVVDARHSRQGPPADDRIAVVAPDQILGPGRFGLPGYVWDRGTSDCEFHGVEENAKTAAGIARRAGARCERSGASTSRHAVARGRRAPIHRLAGNRCEHSISRGAME